jgi:endonuclease/exonuclease/phosphatase family metal-dependent hydrolase
VVRELAEALGMNWAYGVEFVEVDPVQLGTEEFAYAPKEEREELRKQAQVDESRYRGLHGTAILSRYRIKQATLTPLEQQAYDWYKSEKERVSQLEKGRRIASEKLFLENILREIRRGGRTLLTATLDVPDLGEKQITVVAPHLENHCKPEKRAVQMKEVLRRIQDIRNPVVLAGDLNTSLQDAHPTTVKREVYKRLGSGSFWAERGLKWATGVGLAYDVITGGAKFFKNLNDPTARHIPLVAPNPEAELFELMEKFRFADNGAFDFRGDANRTANGREGTLANSNQRAQKGFMSTYAVTRTIGPVGRFKLDWIFVKSYLRDLRDPRGTYRFAPHYARTLEEINNSILDELSDHYPMTVDLPLGEPSL